MIADLEQFELIHVSRLGLKGQVLRRALRQHFTAIIGDRNRVLPLRGQATVSCGYGPAITRIELRVAFSRIHHGFDRKRHSFLEHHASPCSAVVKYLRLFMENSPYSMAAILSDHRIIGRLSILLYDLPNIAKACPGFHQRESFIEALLCNVNESFSVRRNFPDWDHNAGVSVPTVFDDSYVDINNVAILQYFRVGGDAMTNDIIDRCADLSLIHI